MHRSAAVAGAVVLTVASLATACDAPPVASNCHSNVVIGPVPEWADAGFTDGAEVAHVVGDSQRIVAVYFADELVAADAPAPVNKLLLVAREPLHGPTPVSIDARLEAVGPVVHRVREDGPGPGTLDLPSPGCWRLTLTWADQRDTLDLQYTAPDGT